MAETKYEARLKTLYNKEIAKQLKEELGLKNINQVPKLEKIMVSSGVGKKREDKRFTETVELTLTKITGQAVTARQAKKSIAQFKIRKGMGAPVGYVTTLRNDKMYEFVDRLVNIALPHVRDFHGVPRKFDAQGNYSLGMKEQTVFPEISFEDAAVLHGLEITFVIKNGSQEGSAKLLEKFGMPFERRRANNMAKTSAVLRDEKRRKMYEKYAEKRAELKAAGDIEGLQKLPRNSSPTRLKNRDMLDGRPRGYMRRFGLSRINFREKASKGEIPGVTKSSW